MCSEDIVEKVNLSSTELPYGEDEFNYAGLTPIKSDLIKPNRVLESPLHYECKLRDILNYGDHPGGGRLITGEVVKIHIREDVYEEGRVLTNIAKPAGRGVGNDWFKTDAPFEMPRLMNSQIQK